MFFNKIPEQSIFRGATSRSFVMVMFHLILIAVIFCNFFYIAVSNVFREGHWPWLHPWRPLIEIRDRFKGNIFFLEITMFLGLKIDKTGTD